MSNQPNNRQERIFKIFTPVRCMNRDQLPRYVLGNMTDVEKHLVEQHLVDCDLCCAAILALQSPRQHETYNQYSTELSNYLHREYAPASKQQKKQVRARHPHQTQDSLLSGFWIIMFIVIGGGSIFLLQQHLKNRPLLTLASARVPEILPSTPLANTDSTYTEAKLVGDPAQVSMAPPKDSVRKVVSTAKDSVKKTTLLTPKDTLQKTIIAKTTDTATRVAAKKPDTSTTKAETPKADNPPEEKKPVEKKEIAPPPPEKPADEKPAAPASGDETLFRAAIQYQQQGNIDEAIDTFRKLSTNYRYAERAKYQLALCYRTKGQHAKAKRLFKEIVKMDGNMKAQAQSQLDKN